MIKIATPVKPTESREKVMKALGNLFPDVEFSGKEKIGGKADDIRTLEVFIEKIKKQEISETAKSLLASCSDSEGKLRFELNKQAAYAGKVNFTDFDTPLGNITVETDDGDLLLESL